MQEIPAHSDCIGNDCTSMVRPRHGILFWLWNSHLRPFVPGIPVSKKTKRSRVHRNCFKGNFAGHIRKSNLVSSPFNGINWEYIRGHIDFRFSISPWWKEHPIG